MSLPVLWDDNPFHVEQGSYTESKQPPFNIAKSHDATPDTTKPLLPNVYPTQVDFFALITNPTLPRFAFQNKKI